MIKKALLIAVILSLSIALFPAHATSTYTPRQGDTFSYYEVSDVGSGYGLNYSGYTDHTVTNGVERMNGVFVNGTVAANYTYTWNWNDNQGSPPKTEKSSGNFTWSSTSFLYVKGTDNQTGYVSPTVWFYMDNSVPQSGTFYLLNTPMTITSTSYSYHLASQNQNVYTIRATGTSSYHRDDRAYGAFNAAYTWTAFFDPTTGYIIGYDYRETDTNSTTNNGFTYTDSLYVTSTSYPLTAGGGSGLSQYLGIILAVVLFILVIVIIAVIAFAVSRRKRSLPRHPPQPQYYQPPAPAAPPPQINLEPRQPPVQQIVVKEVVKVKCRYCGALIDSTAQSCPFCGAPRT